LLIATIASASVPFAQQRKLAGAIFTPQSSIRTPQPLIAGLEGVFQAFTNVVVFVPAIPIEPPTAAAVAPAPYFIETPASIACIYSLVPRTSGCNPNVVRTNPSGGGKVVAIVDAYDAPNIRDDLKVFSDRFNLPSPSAVEFSIVFASGIRPEAPAALKEGWEIEISLDVEWAHAIAPSAKIILVEANSNSYADLMAAVDMAANIVTQQGGGEISLSWGGSEFSRETVYDAHFAKDGVVYFAATGDVPGVSYPSSSPQVVAVGGTSIVRDQSTGEFIGEKPWSSAGAGPSAVENIPSYQSSISNIVGAKRGTPDLAAVADPNAGGVWVYDSGNASVGTNKGWLSVGGTSAATPIVAAIANLGGRFAASSADELSHVYRGGGKFNKILAGTCGPLGIYASAPGWNFCTGVGSPNGTSGL